MVSVWVTALILSGMMAGVVADVVAVPPDLSHDEEVLNGQPRQGVSGRTRPDGRPLDNDRKSDASARPDKTGEYQEGSGGTEEPGPQTMTSTDCVQRMVQWISRVNEGANTTLLAGIATLGLVISSGMVACGLAVWLCGVGWRHAQGPVARAGAQSYSEREDHRTRAGSSRTRNPQRKGYSVGETEVVTNGADPTLSEPPTLDGAERYRRSDGTNGGGGPVLAHRAARTTVEGDKGVNFSVCPPLRNS